MPRRCLVFAGPRAHSCESGGRPCQQRCRGAFADACMSTDTKTHTHTHIAQSGASNPLHVSHCLSCLHQIHASCGPAAMHPASVCHVTLWHLPPCMHTVIVFVLPRPAQRANHPLLPIPRLTQHREQGAEGVVLCDDTRWLDTHTCK